MTFIEQIRRNNATHVVDKTELARLLKQAHAVFLAHHPNTLHFERSLFTNWTCGIADCKYCFLSTRPKHTFGTPTDAKRSHTSILAEAIVCKLMGWRIGYLTGGLRVETTDELIDLAKKMHAVLGEKVMFNFGPFAKSEVEKLAPYVSGMGSAIESFDEELHSFICPSKPLKQLLMFLEHLETYKLKKIITIILGMGEKMGDVDVVIEKVAQYKIDTIQLCFLKPQEATFFADVPAPDMSYMAWWAAKLRIAHPTLIIKVALVRNRVDNLHLLLEAGVNCFSRFLVWNDFAQPFARTIVEEAKKAGRDLQGHFIDIPPMDIDQEISGLPFDEECKYSIKEKAEQYVKKLKLLSLEKTPEQSSFQFSSYPQDNSDE